MPVRILDALHLASLEFLGGRGQRVELASYDDPPTRRSTRVGRSAACIVGRFVRETGSPICRSRRLTDIALQ